MTLHLLGATYGRRPSEFVEDDGVDDYAIDVAAMRTWLEEQARRATKPRGADPWGGQRPAWVKYWSH